MTVLKANVANGVRALTAVRVGEPRRISEPRVDSRIADLTAQLAEADAALVEQHKQAVAEIAAAREEGAAEVRLDEDRRVAQIEQGVTVAIAAWRERLDSLERLAAVLAETALAKVFDDHADFAEQVGRTLAKQVRAMNAGAVVRVRVSARDFPDDAALGALAARVGLPVSAIGAESDAAAGACEIDLAVGHLDLTVTSQWHAIAQRLAAIASEEMA